MIARRLLVLLLTLLIAPACLAEAVTLKPGQALRGRFTQERILAGFDRPVISQGTFLLVAGRGLVWRGETPFAITTVITGAGILQAVDGRERMRLTADKAPFLARLHQMMSGVMAGDWQALRDDFVVRDGREGALRILDLVPRSVGEGQPIQAIRVTIRDFVEEVEIVRPGGDRDRISFSAQSLGPAALTPDEAALLDFAPR